MCFQEEIMCKNLGHLLFPVLLPRWLHLKNLFLPKINLLFARIYDASFERVIY